MRAEPLKKSPPSSRAPSPLDRLDLRSSAQLNRALQEHRFPLVERGWFVFVYHDPEQRADSVHLLHGLIDHRHPPPFQRRRGGLYTLALYPPAVLRMEYRFQIREGTRHSDVNDILNPLTVAGPVGWQSVALAPGYAAPLCVQPPPPEAKGTISAERLPVFVDAAGHPRFGEAFFWRPPDDRPEEPLPLLVVLDGPEYFHFAGLRRVLENLVHQGRIRRCRAVLLPPADRPRQYSANPAMATYLADTLPQLLAERLAVPESAEERIGIGASLGGLALLHAHCSPRRFFGKLLLQSGSFFQPRSDAVESGFPQFSRIAHFVSEVLGGTCAVHPIPLYLTCGVGEENLTNNRNMVDALRRAGCLVEFVENPDAHNWTAWRDSVGAGLEALLRA